MPNLFPIDVGMTKLRGVLKLVKEHGGTINVSALAEEAREEVDDLLPLIDAAEMLGLVQVDSGVITLLDKTAPLDNQSFLSMVRPGLAAVEPFKSVISVLKQKLANTTPELAAQLNGKGVQLHEDNATNEEMLRGLLLAWGVGAKLLSYDAKTDGWKVK
ncbi:MAG: AAA-associated domain-containing protein [Candidatus Marsarchaeota archaeon]|jgi:NitT/TauT family transport system ATP-binding protein|nr:AAA-associated domain-containing protein [Candidatus Marsarchaeota archaeon]